MKRTLAVALVLVGAGLAAVAGLGQGELQPVPAAQADRRVAETRDWVVDVLWEYTDTFWHVGNYEECIRLCRQCVELDPNFVEAYTSGAWLLSNLNRDVEAVEMYHEGMSNNPDSPDLWQQLGLLYHRRHKYAEAVEQFREAAKRGAPPAWQRMVPGTLERMGNLEEARQEWREFLKRFPDDPVGKRRLEALERELQKEKQEKEA